MKIVAIAVLALGLLAPGVASAASWGSIAFSASTQATGWTHGYANQTAAENAALDLCNRSADDCVIAISFRNACGAVAVGANGGWGADWGTADWDAQQSALGACGEHDSGCRVLRWQCSGV
jgi:serine/threonine-protein kinase